MSRAAFIRDLAELLLRLEGGMQEFASPVPMQTEDSLLTAIVAFGDEAVPILLERFTASYERISHGYIIDALKRIGNPAAVPAIITFHQTFGTFLSCAEAMSALRILGTEQAYLYLGETLTRYALGNPRVVESPLELVIACRALGEWGDHRAIAPLMAAAQIHREAAGMPQAALEALAHYPVTHTYLEKVAQQQAHTADAMDERHGAQDADQSNDESDVGEDVSEGGAPT